MAEHTMMTIYGDHDRAVDIASYLFYLGRPGIKPADIEEVEVQGPDVESTSLWRNTKGEVIEGALMLCGTMAQIARYFKAEKETHTA